MDPFELMLGRAALSRGEAYRAIEESVQVGESATQRNERLRLWGLDYKSIERDAKE